MATFARSNFFSKIPVANTPYADLSNHPTGHLFLDQLVYQEVSWLVCLFIRLSGSQVVSTNHLFGASTSY